MTKSTLLRLCNFYDMIEGDRPYERVKMVAFVVVKNKIISFGVNSEKTSAAQHYWRCRVDNENNVDFVYDKTHAEVAAIKKIHPSFDFSRAEIFVCSRKKNREYRVARPCPICEGMLREIGIKKIYYTTGNGIVKEEFV